MNSVLNMRDTEYEWIGTIPSHWDLKKIKFVFWDRKENNNPIKSENLISLTIEKGVIPHSEKTGGGNKPKEDLTKYKLVYPGDIVLNSMNVIAGAVGISKYFGVVSPVYYMLIPKDLDHSNEYFHHLFRTETFQKSLYGLGNGILIKENEETGKLNTIRMRIPMDKLGDQFIPVPPSEEQKLISLYLDKKTEQIDRLVEKTQKKIALLKEQRISLINQCVTKGLDQNVEMKDSGVEWIGEIPKHWKVTKLGFLGQFSNGVSKGSEFFGNGSPFINYSDVYKNDIIPKPSGLFRSSEKDWETYSVEKGDIFFTRTSETIDDIGVSSVCMETIDHCCFSGFLVKFRPNDDTFNTKYSRYYFRSSIPLTHYTKEMNLVTRASLSQGTLKTTPILIPPTIEQIEITQYLTRRLGIIDEIFRVETDKIKVLEEYRQSLISSVITGKVRIADGIL